MTEPGTEAAYDLLIEDTLRTRINSSMEAGKLAGGWLVTGPRGIGKATLSEAIARAHLSSMNRLGDSDPTTDALVANRGHPDLFILQRTANEKTGRLRSEISVDVVREVIGKLHHTSTTGRRVVIVDLADELGRSAANALLKTLEEPPAGTCLLLLSIAPGKLLPTIRSRCRRLAMSPMPEATIAKWTEQHTDIPDEKRAKIVSAAAGRPGRVLDLLTEVGEKAQELAEAFFQSVEASNPVRLTEMAAQWTKRDADEAWEGARDLVLDRISRNIRHEPDRPGTPALIGALEDIRELSGRAIALNADRQQTLLMMARRLREATKVIYAGR